MAHSVSGYVSMWFDTKFVRVPILFVDVFEKTSGISNCTDSSLVSS